MARRCDSLNTGYDFGFMVNKFQLALNRGEVLACESQLPLSYMFIELCFRLSRGPELPLILPHYIPGVGESWPPLVVSVPTDVVWMSVGDDDRVNVLRRNPYSLQVLNKLSCAWGKTIGTRIHQHLMLACVNCQANVWACPL